MHLEGGKDLIGMAERVDEVGIEVWGVGTTGGDGIVEGAAQLGEERGVNLVGTVAVGTVDVGEGTPEEGVGDADGCGDGVGIVVEAIDYHSK